MVSQKEVYDIAFFILFTFFEIIFSPVSEKSFIALKRKIKGINLIRSKDQDKKTIVAIHYISNKVYFISSTLPEEDLYNLKMDG